MTDGREIVRTGYERLGARYWEWSRDNDPKFRDAYLASLMDQLEPGSIVVDLGSGSGIPTAHVLSERHRVVCVDFAAAQLALVTQNAPGARRIQADMSSVQFLPGTIDAVVAFYSIIHVPRERHRTLFGSISTWLRSGGLFVASMGANVRDESTTEEWIDGVEMYWSFYDADTNLKLIRDAGLIISRGEVLTNFEDGREARFLWLLASKPR